MNFINTYAKSFAAFIATVLGNMVVSLINGSAPWPHTTAEWLQYLVTSFGAAFAAWAARNKITQKQLDKDPNVVGGTVVSEGGAPPSSSGLPYPDDSWK